MELGKGGGVEDATRGLDVPGGSAFDGGYGNLGGEQPWIGLENRAMVEKVVRSVVVVVVYEKTGGAPDNESVVGGEAECNLNGASGFLVYGKDFVEARELNPQKWIPGLVMKPRAIGREEVVDVVIF